MKMKKMSLEKKVFISSKTNVFFLCPPKGGHLSIKAAPPGAVSYKVKKLNNSLTLSSSSAYNATL